KKRIGILCLQETHLCTDHQAKIDNLFVQRLTVMNTSDLTRPGSSAGVAFVLNKEITNTSNTSIKVIIPGRAAVLSLKWHNDEAINILVDIYTPNNASEHLAELLGEDRNGIAKDRPRNTSVDFNLTENLIDRAPAKIDNERAINALRDLIHVQDT
ncbi:hypothetical protein EV424DRAFT_1323549, partial [Suillus variegatus]